VAFFGFLALAKAKKSTYLEAKRIGSLFMASKIQKPKSQKKPQQKGPEYVRGQGDMLVGSWVHMISLFRNSSSIHFEMSKKNKTKNACVLLRLLYTHKIFQWKIE
jgi:hypothetical protein